MDEIMDGLVDQLTMKQNLNGGLLYSCLSKRKTRLQSKSTTKILKCEKVNKIKFLSVKKSATKKSYV